MTTNSFSLKKLTTAAVLVGLTLAVPVSVWVVKQDTELRSGAYFEKPAPNLPGKNYGLPSDGHPQIDLVWPFLGKVDDAVLIQGQNLGDNPLDKVLKLGGVVVPEEKILRWTPTLIEFQIPPLSSGGLTEVISLSVAGKVASWEYPFTVYDTATRAQVSENQDVVTVSGCPGDALLDVYFEDGQTISARVDAPISVPPTSILTLRLKDASGQLLPFFVEPAEFGF